MARPPSAAPTRGTSSPMTEFGATGLRQFSGYVREEWLRELSGWRGLRVFREMRDNDPVIGAIFFALEMLLRGVSFQVEASDAKNPDDIEASDFVNSCLADMEHSWPELMAEIMSFLQFGWDVHEIVYKRRRGASNDPATKSRYDDGMIGWRKFAHRAQETLLHWTFDESGDAVALVQLLPTGGPLLTVPLAKSLHFRTVALKNNPEGRSILRNSYTPWYYKKRIQEIEAVGLERDLTGLPIVWIPPKLLNKNASQDDKDQLAVWQSIARDVSRNEQEGLVLPLAYDKDGKNKLYDITLLSTAGKRAFDTSAIVDRYDHRITATVLADFIVLGQGSSMGRGSFAQSKNKTDMFGTAALAFLDLIAAEFNRRAIPDLLSLNAMPGMCKMTHGDIARKDLEELGQFIMQTAQVGALIPDAPLEEHLRTEAGLPPPAGEQRNDLNDGGGAEEGSDVSGDETVSNDPALAQGRGAGALAADGVTPRPLPKRRR